MNNNSIKLKVQMSLDEFIGTEYEEKIITKLYNINKLLARPLILNFWYDPTKNIVNANVVKKFVIKWESKLPFKTNITPRLTDSPHDFIWFNIVHRSDFNKTIWTRFDYVYDTHIPVNILNGLDSFEKVAQFCLKPKPEKNRSKRSD